MTPIDAIAQVQPWSMGKDFARPGHAIRNKSSRKSKLLSEYNSRDRCVGEGIYQARGSLGQGRGIL
jgi:hypothetical protein